MRIAVFDSGLGGLSVLRAIAGALPGAEYIYLADDAAFPYGDLSTDGLMDTVRGQMAQLLADEAPDIVVIACNTASTMVLPMLRAQYHLPFVGTVPAIKPAALATASGMVSVLATPGTIERDYTRDLIRDYAAHVHVRLVGCPGLAGLAEVEMTGRPVDDAGVLREISPAFMEADDGRRTDVVVLGCTHYPLIAETLARIAPWPVTWIDPAPAIARRVAAVLDDRRVPVRPAQGGVPVSVRMAFSSGRRMDDATRTLIRNIGLRLIC